MDEFKVKYASDSNSKRFKIFKLHKDDNVNWAETKMRRENEFQPWQMKSGAGRSARRYKALKEGGVGDNASYFVFYKSKEASDTYEVCPIEEWYNVSATQRYKTLTAEEAEQKFEQRHKTLNFFSVMHLKKSNANDEDGLIASESKSFKVSELDEWAQSGDEFDDSDGNNDDEDNKKKRKKKVKEEQDDAPDEGKEDSDEGDYEQREVDYMSDTSESSISEDERKDETDVKGIAEEEALRDLLSTDEDEDAEGSPHKGSKSGADKNQSGTTGKGQDQDGNSSEDTSDSEDYDVDEDKMDSMMMQKGLQPQLVKQEYNFNEANASSAGGSGTTPGSNQKQVQPAATKRKAPAVQSVVKKPCTIEPSTFAAPNSQEKVVEDLIKKYLGRKPMTLKILLKEIKSKLKRMGSQEPNDLVEIIAKIFKRLNLEKQKINNVTYFSLKS